MTLRNTIAALEAEVKKLTAERDILNHDYIGVVEENRSVRSNWENTLVDLGLAESTVLRLQRNLKLTKEALVSLSVKTETGENLESDK